jgi:ABC-type multidrug transport system permease subunit
MTKLLNLTWNDLRIIFSNRAVWFNIVIFPALFIVVVGLATGAGFSLFGGSSLLAVDIINHDSSKLSGQLTAILQTGSSDVVVCPTARAECPDSLDLAAAEQRLQDGTTRGFIEIPSDFEENLLDGKDTRIVYRSGSADPTAPDPLLVILEAALRQINGAAVAARAGLMAAQANPNLAFSSDAERSSFLRSIYQRATLLWETQPAPVTYHETLNIQGALKQNSFGQSMPGMGIYGVMVNVGVGLFAIIEERRNGTLQRLLTMPVTRAQILGGKILPYFLMGMLVFTVSFAVGMLLGVNLHNQWLAFLLVMTAFTACMTALTLLLAALLQTQQTAQAVSTLLALSLAALGGAFWPMEIVPTWMQTIGHLSPVAWAMDGFKSLIFYGGTLNTVITPVVVLLVMTILFFIIGLSRLKVS